MKRSYPSLYAVNQLAKNTARHALGRRIKYLRTSQRLSIRRLALMVGVDYSYLCNIENGKANATIDVIEKIALGLNVEIQDLFSS